MNALHRSQQWPYKCKLLIILFYTSLCGCSREKMEEMVATVQEKSQAIVESPAIAKVLSATGGAEVKLSTPVTMKAAYARIYPIGDGRPHVVQLTSYEPTAGPVEYPSLLIRLQTQATNLEQLGGQSVEGRVFFQAASTSPVLSSSDNSPISVTFAAMDPEKKTLDATMGPFTFQDPSGNSIEAMGLTIQGLLP